MLWHKVAVPLHQKTKRYSHEKHRLQLGSFLSSDVSFQALKDLIDDLGLEVEGVTEF